MKQFALVCVNCLRLGRDPHYTHIHCEYGDFTFKCFSCGREERLVFDMRRMPSEKEHKKLIEMREIEKELNKLSQEDEPN